MKKRISAVIFISLFLIVPASYSATGVKMLTNEFGARSVGMGGAFSSVPADPYSAAYNPAATWGITNLKGSLGYDTHWGNSRLESGYLSFEKRSVVVTTGVQFAAVDDMQGRTGPTVDYIEFGAHDISIKAGAAFELEKNYYLGFSLGYIYEKIDTYDDAAFNFDLGLLVQPMKNMNVGLAVTNFGSTIKIRSEAVDLPTAYRAGVSYVFGSLTSAADVVHLDGDNYFHLGGEYCMDDRFFLRAGYRLGYETKDFSAGVGFSRKNLRIDYAFLPYKGGLSDSHLFNLTFEL